MHVSVLPPLLIIVAIAVSPTHVSAAKKSAQATICLRSMELSSLDAASRDRLQGAVEMDLAKREVHVALVSDARRGSRSPCSPRVARSKKGVLFLDLRALRVGPVIKLSLAFYRPGKRAPAIERKWSAESTAVVPSKELSDTLAKGALLAHELAGSRPRATSGVAVNVAPPPTDRNTDKATGGDAVASTDVAATGDERAESVETVEETSSPLFWASIATMGVGAAGLATGAAFGIKGLIHKNNASDTSTPGSQLEIPRMEESQKIANWSFLVGGTIAATGFVMWLLSDSGADPQAAVAMSTTADGCLVFLVGEF